jgi:hypothetical protein
MDAEQAARDLAEVDRRMRRGTALTLPRWWHGVWLLFFVLLRAQHDITEQRLRGILWLGLGAAMLATATFAMLTVRAHPLPGKPGWRAWLAIAVLVLLVYALTRGLEYLLQRMEVPLPHTLGSTCMLIMLVTVNQTGRLHGDGRSYLERIRRW